MLLQRQYALKPTMTGRLTQAILHGRFDSTTYFLSQKQVYNKHMTNKRAQQETSFLDQLVTSKIIRKQTQYCPKMLLHNNE